LVKKPNKLLINFLKLAFTLVVLYFLGKEVHKHWAEIRDYQWDVRYGYLLLSIICAEAALLIFALAWRRIIGSFGFSVTAAEAFKISYLSNLGRYIPGKIWQLFGILYLASKKNIPAESAGASFVIFQLFTIPAAFLVFVLAAQIDPVILVDKVALLGEVSGYLIAGLMVLLCALLVFYPEPFLKAANVLLRRLSRPEIAFRLDKTVALRIFLCYCLGWIVYGLAFWLLLLAVAHGASPGLTASIGIYAVAYQIGYLFLIAPGGFGPRELVMAALLAPFAGPIASAVVIVARLWSIIIEAIAALIALRVRM
jgi:hypothetical protein